MDLILQHPFWTWVAIGGTFLIGELLSGSGWLLWPAGAAAVTAIVAQFARIGWFWEIVLFAVVSVILTYVGRRFLRPPVKDDERDINDPTPRLVGREGEAASAFLGGKGRVFVDGKEWAAELDGGGDLAA